jgi:hypothetical protein
VRASLNQRFPNRWIGCADAMSRQAKSPNVTRCYFFLWSYVKDCVYQIPVVVINDLKNKTAAAVATVNVDMLQHAWMGL